MASSVSPEQGSNFNLRIVLEWLEDLFVFTLVFIQQLGILLPGMNLGAGQD